MGYDYLKRISQPCEVDGGPRKCALLYCEDGSAIWLCNDNETRASQSCAYIADYVLEIIGDLDCASTNDLNVAHFLYTQGQVVSSKKSTG